MKAKFPKTFGSPCRNCDHYVKQEMENLSPETHNKGIRLACVECGMSNWCPPEEND